MSTRITDEPISGHYFESLAAGLSNAAINYYNVRRGFREYLFQPANTTGGFFIHVWLNPRISGMWWYKSSNDSYTDLIDGGVLVNRANAGTSTITTMPSTDAIYIVTKDVVGGFYFDLTALNNNASVITVTYSDSATTIAGALTETDGTDVAGATLAQDGLVTWTAPTDQVITDGRKLGLPGLPPTELGFWYKVTVSLALDTISFAQVAAVNKDANNYLRFRANTVPNMVEYTEDINDQQVGSIGIRGSETTATYTLGANYIKRSTGA